MIHEKTNPQGLGALRVGFFGVFLQICQILAKFGFFEPV
jgi:hypothetical protein